jgi:hypothetical protein
MTSRVGSELPLTLTSGSIRSIGPRRLDANRQNALLSTGPRTPEGKRASSRNALRHGLRALTPVVPGVEREADWLVHRAGLAASLAPEGYLEECLCDRIALQLWRLGRVARYERQMLRSVHEAAPGVVSQTREERRSWAGILEPTSLAGAEATVARWRETRRLVESLSDLAEGTELPGSTIFGIALFLTQLTNRTTDTLTLSFGDGTTVPLDDLGLDRRLWPAIALRSIADFLAGDYGSADFLEAAISKATERERIAEADKRAILAEIQGLRNKGMLPDDHELDKLSRYEAALERSLMRTLHELQRLQAARMGGAVAPLALDVDFATS